MLPHLSLYSELTHLLPDFDYSEDRKGTAQSVIHMCHDRLAGSPGMIHFVCVTQTTTRSWLSSSSL